MPGNDLRLVAEKLKVFRPGCAVCIGCPGRRPAALRHLRGGPVPGSQLREQLHAEAAVNPLPRQAESSQELLLATSEDAHIDLGGETCFGATVL